MKKVAMITGANKGIGLETARQLGRLDFTVLLTARDKEAGARAVDELKSQDIDAHLVVMSPTDPKSVHRAAQEVESKFGVLDVLINNAGTLLPADLTSPSKVPLSALRETFEINVFALHDVTCACWPLLNKSKAARLVNVSSILGSLTMHSDGSLGDFKVLAYDASKAAVNMMTTHYAFEWRNTPHRANAAHPGSVKTDINPTGELSVEEGAKTSVQLATLGADGPNGGYFHLGKRLPW